MFPIKNYNYEFPLSGPASFGFKRKFDYHTGIDLYCETNAEVYSIEDGIVIGVEIFTGPNAGSPWWNETYSVLIESEHHVILYGEIETHLKLTDNVKEDDVVGSILQVLKQDKGKNPTSMLHIEQYIKGTTESVWWKHNELQPSNLIDITNFLKSKL